MNNMMDYLNWRGDILFNNDFNEIDNIILSRISYFPWDKLINKDSTILNAYLNEKKSKMKNEDSQLFELLSKSKRYEDLIISKVVNKFDSKKEIQFFAITILLPNNLMYVSFRGTDSTSVGLKEDFNMSFSDDVPSQHCALEYLNTVGNIYRQRKILVGGHSKGGNLAIYSSMNSLPEIKKRIVKIYNNDGPGFQEEIIQSKNYKSIIKKVITYVPQTSIVGRLLNHEEGYQVVKSNAKGLKEHSLYSWEVMGNHFIYQDALTKQSDQIEDFVNKFLQTTSKEDREQTIDVFYTILMSAHITDFSDFNIETFKKITNIINSYQTISKEDKRILSKIFTYIFNIVKENLKEKLKSKKGAL